MIFVELSIGDDFRYHPSPNATRWVKVGHDQIRSVASGQVHTAINQIRPVFPVLHVPADTLDQPVDS